MGLLSWVTDLPSLSLWGRLVEEFSSREFTYEQDARAAFAGATEVSGATFPGGIFQGLPVFFFDIALLWQPWYSGHRRPGEPSWSWIGWEKVEVRCCYYWEPFFGGLFIPGGEMSDWVAPAMLKRVALFSIKDTPNDEAAISVNLNGFHSYQDYREVPAERLPEGWSRCRHPTGDYFINSAASQELRYGFPLPTADPAKRRPEPPSSSVLSCTAAHQKLTLGSPIDHTTGPHRTWTIYHDQKLIGNLVPNGDTKPPPCLRGGTCDIIALSEAETSCEYLKACFHWPQELFENNIKNCKDFATSGTTDAKHAFYHVMWIEWVGEIAERRGIGAVLKAYWDALRPETMTFILG